jgi:hypothetical protein
MRPFFLASRTCFRVCEATARNARGQEPILNKIIRCVEAAIEAILSGKQNMLQSFARVYCAEPILITNKMR